MTTDRIVYFFANTYGLSWPGAEQLAAYERDGGCAIRVQILMNLDHCTLESAIAIVETTDADMEREELAEAMSVGPQEPPQDFRIFNRRQPDGTYRPLADFFFREAR